MAAISAEFPMPPPTPRTCYTPRRHLAPSFASHNLAGLLAQALAEHEKEVSALMAEVARLSATSSSPSWLPRLRGSPGGGLADLAGGYGAGPLTPTGEPPSSRHGEPLSSRGEFLSTAASSHAWRHNAKENPLLNGGVADDLQGEGEAHGYAAAKPDSGVQDSAEVDAAAAEEDILGQDAGLGGLSASYATSEGQQMRSAGTNQSRKKIGNKSLKKLLNQSTSSGSPMNNNERPNPPRRCCWCISDRNLELFCFFAISLNVVFLFLQLQHEGLKAGAALGVVRERQGMEKLQIASEAVEHAFCVMFIFELLVRLIMKRREFFVDPHKGIDWYNAFDLVCVFGTCMDLYIISPLTRTGSMNLTVLRPMRFLRFLRILRIFSTVSLFMKLRVLVNSVMASFYALFWSVILLAIVMLMSALFMCQSLAGSLDDDNISLETRQWVYQMYGTSARATYTVFELTFSGGWPNYARRLVEEVSSLYALFFFFYILSVVFAMFRIITALFLRDTMALAAADAELAVQMKMKQKQDYAKALEQFFEAADTSGDGFLTMDEFTTILSDQHVITWLSLMEIDTSEASELFMNMDSGDGVVSSDEFVHGISQMKGQARAEDLISVKLGQRKLRSHVDELHEDMRRMHDGVQEIQSLVSASHKLQLSQQSRQIQRGQDSATNIDFAHLRV